jgi:dihydroflavonol-4-reductase
MAEGRVLVTGASGFIGGSVVRLLRERDREVRCLVRETSDQSRIEDLSYEVAVGDLRDPSSLQEAVKGCAAVIHLACLSSWDDISSPRMREVGLEGTRHLLDAAKSAGVERFVFASSIVAIGGTLGPEIRDEDAAFELAKGRAFVYAHTKREAEVLCQEATEGGLPVVIVNPGEVYGPHDLGLVTASNLIDFARSNPVFVPRGGTSVAHVDDVAAGILAALQSGRPGARYVLGGENLTIHQLATLTLDVLGQRKRVVTLPKGLLLALAWLGRVLRIPLPFHPAVIPYAVRYWWYDNSRAREELGVVFRNARATLEPTLRWLEQAGHV